MASPFPSSGGGTSPLTQAEAWVEARAVAAQIKSAASAIAASSQSGPVSGLQIANFAGFLASQNTALTACAAVPEIVAYAEAQINNPTFDIAGSFTAMQNAVVATVQWITTNFPKDTSNFLQFITFDVNGNLVYSTFSVAQLAGFVTQLNALIATIN